MTGESVSELDYAMNRFYGNRYGRFMSPDPIEAARCRACASGP